MAPTPESSSLLSPQLLAQLERLELVTRKVFRGRLKGERRSKRKGQSVEFADFRSYVPGDDLRFIDWNTYARLERLFLKMFLEEEDLHFYAVIDTLDHKPSIDILRSGTRKDELLVDKGTLAKMYVLRRILAPMGTIDAIEFLLDKLRQTKTNGDFFDSMNA